MADENIILVTNNENPPINLEIISYKNEVGVSYVQSKGDKGDIGEKGDKGNKGDKGDLAAGTMFISSFTGAINGSNTTFVLNDNYDDVIIFINGIKYGSTDYSYTKSTKTIVFSFAIPTGYTLEFYGITNKTANVVPLEDLSVVASSGSYNDLTNKPSIPSAQANSDWNAINGVAQILNKPTIPSKTSDLSNDSHFAIDANYIHTDNNLTNALKSNYDTAYTNNHSHANSNALNNVSGTNTGDETASSIKSKLGITTLSGNNTGDQDLSGLVTKTTTVNGHALSSNVTVTATDVGAPTISSGNGAPSSTPAKVGDVYVDTTNYKTFISKGNSSSADWVKQNGSYTIHASTAYYITPNNVTTYYFGTLNYACQSLTTSAPLACKMFFQRSGTISRIDSVISCTPGTNETSSIYLRINDTTDYLIFDSFALSTFHNTFSNTSTNIPVTAGDYGWFKWTMPNFTTKPTYLTPKAQILVNL
jgi:hypothetical protein